MVEAAKLFKNGHMVWLNDLPADVQHRIKTAETCYTIPWDVQFKQESLSTPARPVMDASSKTSSGYSLNDLLPKGIPDIINLLEMTLSWRMGPSCVTGDIQQFYNSICLLPEFWQFQKILFKENLDISLETKVAIIIKLIYGIQCVCGQCEEAIKRIAEDIKDIFPEIYKMLTSWG